HVEIIAPVHNRREITLQCLRNLRLINRENLKIHIIIVDDGSSDGTGEAIAREFPGVEIVRGDGDLWYTGGINLGLKTALEYDSDYILTINDDSQFDPNFLVNMVECAETNPRSIIGSLLLSWDEPEKLFQVAPQWDTWFGGWRHLQNQTTSTVPDEAFDVGLIVGNCVLFPTKAVRENGFMNARLFPHFGDAEYTPRMRKNGWRLLIEPKAKVFCKPNDVPKRLSGMSLSQLYQFLWADLRKPHNLRCRFNSYWMSAPTKIQAVAAFNIFIVRLGLKFVGLGGNYPNGWREKTLKELTQKNA
ncbi:MAG: glycosyltransferase family 2 protein, partial [Pyrinomonadaceae bacterium]|nr:glycosyltransferase family 2 protein [Pyrinomonadaceae bacterium]